MRALCGVHGSPYSGKAVDALIGQTVLIGAILPVGCQPPCALASPAVLLNTWVQALLVLTLVAAEILARPLECPTRFGEDLTAN